MRRLPVIAAAAALGSIAYWLAPAPAGAALAAVVRHVVRSLG